MMAGNTVVIKPCQRLAAVGAEHAPGLHRCRASRQGVVNLVMGPGESVGQALQDHPASTASCSPARTTSGCGCSTRSRKDWPRPCIVEMGGKNPAIVTRHADLDEAAEGIMRSAFGFGGQKCSANSRVYVERPVHDELVRLLVEKTEGISHRRPARPRELAGADHRPEGGRPAPGRPSPRRGATDRCSSAASTSPTATWRAGSTSSRPSSVACRPTTACSATSSSRR